MQELFQILQGAVSKQPIDARWLKGTPPVPNPLIQIDESMVCDQLRCTSIDDWANQPDEWAAEADSTPNANAEDDWSFAPPDPNQTEVKMVVGES